MLISIKNLETNEIVYENLEVYDVMYGTSRTDDRLIVFINDAQTLTLSPRENYLVYSADAVLEDEQPEEQETQEDQEQENEIQMEGEEVDIED